MEEYSYSKLDTFEQCPYRYKLTYIDGYRSEESTLALDLGSTAHKGKEIWGEFLINNKEPDLEHILDVVQNGREYWKIHIINGKEVEEELEEDIMGFDEIKEKYFEEYYQRCSKSGMTYDEKIDLYIQSLNQKELKNGWKVLEVEKPFRFIYENKCILHGFIDRIDINESGDLRVVDYKTSKDIYKSEKLATPLQMFIYALACENMYGKLPIEFIYDFIFLNKQQNACTNGYYNRGTKKLNKLLDDIKQCSEKEEFIPKPSPLCHWCSFSNNTCAKDKKLNGVCEYYSLWTPKNKRYDVNKKWRDFANNTDNQTIKRKEFKW